MSLARRAARGAGWSLAQQIGSQTIQFGVISVLAWLLDAGSFGLIATALALVNIAQVIVEGGFGKAIVQRETLEPGHLDTAFWTSISVGLGATLTGVLLSGPISRLYGMPELGPVMAWLSLSILIASLGSTQTAILQREMRFKSLAVRRLIAQSVGGVVGIAMAVGGMGVWSLVGMNVAGRAADAAVVWTASDYRPGFRVSRRHFTDLFSYGANVLGMNLVMIVNQRTPDMLIPYLLGKEAAGYYFLAFRLVSVLVQTLVGAIGAVALPTFSKLQNDADLMGRAYLKAVRLTSAFALPAFAGLGLLAPELIQMIWGPQWLAISNVVRVLTLLGVLQTLTRFNIAATMARGKPSWELIFMSLGAGMNIGLFAVAYWLGGGTVTLAGAFVTQAYLIAPLRVEAVRRLLGVGPGRVARQLVGVAVSTIVMGAAVWATQSVLSGRGGPIVALMLPTSVGVIVYATMLTLLARPLVREAMALGRLAAPDPRSAPR